MPSSYAVSVVSLVLVVLFASGCRGEPTAPEPTQQTPTVSEGVLVTDDASEGGAETAVSPDAAPAEEEDQGMPMASQRREESVTRSLPRSARSARLDITDLLTRGDVRDVTHYTGTLSEAPLEGIAISSNYNAVRFSTEDSLGVGLQVWELASSAATNRQFLRFRDTYVGVRATRSAGDGGFRADFGGIRQLVFMSRRRSTIVGISCDEVVCPTDREIEALAERVESRL